MLVTDPPYGMAYASSRTTHRREIEGDKSTAARDDVLAYWSDRPALVFGVWKIARPAATRHVLIWSKAPDPGMGDLDLPWGNSYEEIYVIGAGWHGKREANVLAFTGYAAAAGDRPDHPTPKPISLMEALIAKCPPGVIVDPFMGSGATLVAAKNLGRAAIGIEIDSRYCRLAARRLAQEVFDFGAAA